MTRRRPLLVSTVLALAVVAVVGWFWVGSLVPGTYSVMDMGYADHGTGPTSAAGPGGHHHGAGTAPVAAPGTTVADPVSVRDLVGDRSRSPDVSYTLTVAQRPDGGYTVNGTSPGPVVEATQGDLVQVVLRNEDVAEGTTLHWHGMDVPNGEDGVAGVTQDAVPAGGEHVYRFVADEPGTYWYHSHQISHEQVVRGLLGAVVVHPAPSAEAPDADGPPTTDVLALLHTYAGVGRTVNGSTGDTPVPLAPGQPARVRLVNTDDGPTQIWVSGAAYRVLAVDGQDLNGPTPVQGRRVTLTAGARVDLEVEVPATGAARVQAPGVSLVLGPAGATAPTTPAPSEALDLLSYGTPADPGFDPARADRRFDYVISRRFGLLDGRPGLWWTINDHLFPDVPMFMVAEGDVVVMTMSNYSGEVHPMHLHGHHALVLSRDGVPSTGSPWWVDSLDVPDGQTYEIAFAADNPGIWMDHCHNLPHAREGLVTHLMYEGVSTPFLVGGPADNEPE
ncbi:multicopper oxidase family protein [Ornithinimicrobium avium]|uniref:Multicopper oxidase family protein n=1 Tax=Ornithinimicrobium avium TaxID=2283195 RepID=A0A345NLF9_9MICO|nr:multicopper oxidase family protein [Ornithinimicrobium avium]AXH95867.1 multicopper oxidase family protein [Ornithinimicrobium avium]